MTIKTPEQIAYEQTALYAQNDFAMDAPSMARALIVVAIEADRAQRASVQEIVEAWDAYDGSDVAGFFDKWGW